MVFQQMLTTTTTTTILLLELIIDRLVRYAPVSGFPGPLLDATTSTTNTNYQLNNDNDSNRK